jgi:collagenase-like PrtC family protease
MYVCCRVALSCMWVSIYVSLCMSRSKKCKLDTFSSGSSDGCVGCKQPHCEQDGFEGG